VELGCGAGVATNGTTEPVSVVSLVSPANTGTSAGSPSAGVVPKIVCAAGGTSTGEGTNGPPCAGEGTGIETAAPRLTWVTELSFPGLKMRIEILVLIC
jgi:hypothetical protein